MDKQVFTKNDLKAMKAEAEYQQYLQNLNRQFTEIRGQILSLARSSDKTNHFINLHATLTDGKQKQYIDDLILKLKESFIDVSIEYKSQTCIRTGKELNKGIYIDWS